MLVIKFLRRLFSLDVLGIQLNQVSNFVVTGWRAVAVGVFRLLGLCTYYLFKARLVDRGHVFNELINVSCLRWSLN